MYLAWAAFYEGKTDAAYFDVLIPRLIDDIVLSEGSRLVTVPETPAIRLGVSSREVEQVAEEICEGREAFHILFIHADTGGRSLESGIENRREAFGLAANELCGWPLERTILLSPRHETEAWALADAEAVCRSLGFTGSLRDLNLPTSGAAADRLPDPKAILESAARRVSGRAYRPGGGLLTSIAQEQSLDALRTSPSFQGFEAELRSTLTTLGCLPQPTT